MRWIPEIARRAPASALSVRYVVLDAPLPFDAADRVQTALAASHLAAQRRGGLSWAVELSGRTRVYGLIAREVDESAAVALETSPEGGEVAVTCTPHETHEAHAAGAAGVIVLAVTVWLTGGWLAGLPLGAATLLAGWIWADAARTLEVQRLEQKVRGLAFDLGRALWPDRPGQVTPLRGPSPLLGR
jgi:hypothetical protein